MTLKEQLEIVERDYPDAWEYLHDIAGVPQPTFDDNDELISWCAIHQVTPQDENKKEDMQEKAKNAVLGYYSKHGLNLSKDNVFVVWFCKTLQNWKCILASTNKDMLLFEVSYNGDKNEMYVDVYDKKENIVVKEEKNNEGND